MNDSSVVLAARDLDVSYGRARVLRGVSLTVRRGEVSALLGPTGAGKSTLFRVLVGEKLPDCGEVRMGGRDVTRLPLWRRARMGVGYIPQTPSVLPDLTVLANLRTFVAMAGVATGGPESWAELVGLSHRLSLRARDLSGGERRLLELARALVGGPRLVVCDEPFSGIDPIGAGKVAALLRRKADEGLAVLLADHHAALALRICDCATLLLDGRIQFEGGAEGFAIHPMVREHYLGEL